ncbi:FapA family protein [Candidatus Pelagadaptatus aseana]|uniref:FapA family protein n=1 Tax=Candidatus Pelagadaptatus aseana TaxID=3120508 RepID=UPI003C6F0F85
MSTEENNQTAEQQSEAPPQQESETKLPYASVQVILDGDDLVARLTPNDSDTPTSKFHLQELIKQQKLDTIPLDETALQELLTKLHTDESLQVIIGARHHAKAELFISGDKMQCTLSITPANGGDPLTMEQLIELLDEEKIAPDCRDITALSSALEQSISGTPVEQQLIATGTEPLHGKDSQFILLLELPKQQETTLEEDGTTNYYETRKYPAISPGTELMRRTEPSKGTPGSDVYGKTLKAKDGKVINFAKHTGSEISANDTNVLIATMKGHPVIGPKSVSISDTLELKNVDLSTGNIHFDGSITITGNVCSQMLVEASGDIAVRGFVENATLKAGNNILIGAGVISEQVDDGDEEAPKFTSTLTAGGNIQALFFNQTDARANGDISARQYAMNSQLVANHKIVMGEGGGKGVLLGGTASAGESVEVNTLGSSAYVKTQLSCASKKRLKQQLELLVNERERRQKELTQLQSFMDKVSASGKKENLGKVLIDKTRKIDAAVKRLNNQLEILEQQLQSLEDLLQNASQATIKINKKLFPNSQISINDIPYINNDERNQTTLAVKGKQVTDE